MSAEGKRIHAVFEMTMGPRLAVRWSKPGSGFFDGLLKRKGGLTDDEAVKEWEAYIDTFEKGRVVPYPFWEQEGDPYGEEGRPEQKEKCLWFTRLALKSEKLLTRYFGMNEVGLLEECVTREFIKGDLWDLFVRCHSLKTVALGDARIGYITERLQGYADAYFYEEDMDNVDCFGRSLKLLEQDGKMDAFLEALSRVCEETKGKRGHRGFLGFTVCAEEMVHGEPLLLRKHGFDIRTDHGSGVEKLGRLAHDFLVLGEREFSRNAFDLDALLDRIEQEKNGVRYRFEGNSTTQTIDMTDVAVHLAMLQRAAEGKLTKEQFQRYSEKAEEEQREREAEILSRDIHDDAEHKLWYSLTNNNEILRMFFLHVRETSMYGPKAKMIMACILEPDTKRLRKVADLIIMTLEDERGLFIKDAVHESEDILKDLIRVFVKPSSSERGFTERKESRLRLARFAGRILPHLPERERQLVSDRLLLVIRTKRKVAEYIARIKEQAAYICSMGKKKRLSDKEHGRLTEAHEDLRESFKILSGIGRTDVIANLLLSMSDSKGIDRQEYLNYVSLAANRMKREELVRMFREHRELFDAWAACEPDEYELKGESGGQVSPGARSLAALYE